MRDTTEVREQDYKGCRIQVTVVGNATQWNWKGQITFPEGRIYPVPASISSTAEQ